MAITIDGVRLNSVSVTRDDDGKIKLGGVYAIMTTNGIQLAKQSFGDGYGETKMSYSGETMVALSALIEQIKKDVNVAIGMG